MVRVGHAPEGSTGERPLLAGDEAERALGVAETIVRRVLAHTDRHPAGYPETPDGAAGALLVEEVGGGKRELHTTGVLLSSHRGCGYVENG